METHPEPSPQTIRKERYIYFIVRVNYGARLF
jgi:hypothetical protein